MSTTKTEKRKPDHIKSIKKLFDCVVCSGPFNTPIEIQCGHIFCSSCLHSMTQCPVCQESVVDGVVKSRDDVHDLIRAFNEWCSTYKNDKQVVDPLCTATANNDKCSKSIVSVPQPPDKTIISTSSEHEPMPNIDNVDNQFQAQATKIVPEKSTPPVEKLKTPSSQPMDLAYDSVNNRGENLLIDAKNSDVDSPLDLSLTLSNTQKTLLRTARGHTMAFSPSIALDLSSNKRKLNELNINSATESLYPQSSKLKSPARIMTPIASNPMVESCPSQELFCTPLDKMFVFCPTRLNRTQMEKLNKLCEICGGIVSRDFQDDVTHVILTLENNRVPQTMKYLFAIAGKKWIVVFDWVIECLKQNKLVPESPFEATTLNFSQCDEGVRASRRSTKPLFKGYTFCVVGSLKSSGASAQDWENLIMKLGGHIIVEPEDISQTTLIVGDSMDHKDIYQNWFDTTGAIAVVWEWVLDSVVSYTLMPLTKGHYVLTDMENADRAAYAVLTPELFPSTS